MKLAVKLYKDVPRNKENKHVPDNWPAQVIENCDTPPSDEWQIMTADEYRAYREKNFVETKYVPKSGWQRFLGWVGLS